MVIARKNFKPILQLELGFPVPTAKCYKGQAE